MNTPNAFDPIAYMAATGHLTLRQLAFVYAYHCWHETGRLPRAEMIPDVVARRYGVPVMSRSAAYVGLQNFKKTLKKEDPK